MEKYVIAPHIFVGMQRWHKETFLSKRLVFTSDIERIIYLVSKEFGVSVNDVKGQCRKRIFTVARQSAIFFIRKYTNKTFMQIAEMFNRDHSSIIYSVNTVNDFMQTDKEYKKQMVKLDAIIFAV